VDKVLNDLLSDREWLIVTAWGENAVGHGWRNPIVWVLFQRSGTAQYQVHAIQPEDQNEWMSALRDVSDASSKSMVSAVVQLRERLQTKAAPPEVVGHWTIDGIPACQSPLTEGLGTVCACTYGGFAPMSLLVRARHPEARVEWHARHCPAGSTQAREEAERREAEEERYRR
jgi:hypothetical protein